MTNISLFTKVIFTLLAAIQLGSSRAQAEDCSAIIGDAMSWLETGEPGYTHSVGFSMTGIKAPAKFVSYGAGGLEFVRGGRPSPIVRPVSYLKGANIQTTFSDRTWCPELGEGFCTGYQAFNYKAADIQQLYLYSNSTAKIVLSTWGNATYTVPLTCSNGFIYGTLVEPTGNSMIVLSLNKGKSAIPR